MANLALWLVMSLPVFLIGEPSVPLWAQIAAAVLLAAAVAVGRRWPVAAAAVPVALTTMGYGDRLMVASLLLAFLLGRRTQHLRTGLIFLAVAGMSGLVGRAVTTGITPVAVGSVAIAVLLLSVLPWLAGRYARQHDELVRTGWELAGQLERERDLVRLRERSRIARDMHDSLGHELSMVALRAATLQVDPELTDSARKAAGELREAAAGATERLHEIIGVLREDHEPPPTSPADETIAALVSRSAASGVAVKLVDQAPSLPPVADRAAYRVVQEALTNAAKHAPGAPVTVKLAREEQADHGVITVTSASVGTGSQAVSGGHGLIGLEERVRLAGGQLRAGPTADGFEVIARIPRAAGAPVAAPQQLAFARRRARRTGIVPVVAVGVLVLLAFGYNRWTLQHSVLDPAVFQQLRVGQSETSVESLLPAYQANDGERPTGAPENPDGTDACHFYRTRVDSDSPLYRLCFTAGRLSSSEVAPLPRT